MDDGKTHSDVQQKWNSQKKKLLSTEEQDAVGAYTRFQRFPILHRHHAEQCYNSRIEKNSVATQTF